MTISLRTGKICSPDSQSIVMICKSGPLICFEPETRMKTGHMIWKGFGMGAEFCGAAGETNVLY
jgi:hypothetical protein